MILEQMEGRIHVYPAEHMEVDGRSPKFERRRGAAQRQIHAQKSVAVSGERKSPSKLTRSCPVIIHVRPVKNGRTVTYTRPVNELILLVNMP